MSSEKDDDLCQKCGRHFSSPNSSVSDTINEETPKKKNVNPVYAGASTGGDGNTSAFNYSAFNPPHSSSAYGPEVFNNCNQTVCVAPGRPMNQTYSLPSDPYGNMTYSIYPDGWASGSGGFGSGTYSVPGNRNNQTYSVGGGACGGGSPMNETYSVGGGASGGGGVCAGLSRNQTFSAGARGSPMNQTFAMPGGSRGGPMNQTCSRTMPCGSRGSPMNQTFAMPGGSRGVPMNQTFPAAPNATMNQTCSLPRNQSNPPGYESFNPPHTSSFYGPDVFNNINETVCMPNQTRGRPMNQTYSLPSDPYANMTYSIYGDGWISGSGGFGSGTYSVPGNRNNQTYSVGGGASMNQTYSVGGGAGGGSPMNQTCTMGGMNPTYLMPPGSRGGATTCGSRGSPMNQTYSVGGSSRGGSPMNQTYSVGGGSCPGTPARGSRTATMNSTYSLPSSFFRTPINQQTFTMPSDPYMNQTMSSSGPMSPCGQRYSDFSTHNTPPYLTATWNQTHPQGLLSCTADTFRNQTYTISSIRAPNDQNSFQPVGFSTPQSGYHTPNTPIAESTRADFGPPHQSARIDEITGNETKTKPGNVTFDIQEEEELPANFTVRLADDREELHQLSQQHHILNRTQTIGGLPDDFIKNCMKCCQNKDKSGSEKDSVDLSGDLVVEPFDGDISALGIRGATFRQGPRKEVQDCKCQPKKSKEKTESSSKQETGYNSEEKDTTPSEAKDTTPSEVKDTAPSEEKEIEEDLDATVRGTEDVE